MSLEDTARNASNLIRFGTVAEVDLAAARVRVQSGDIITDWLPWLVPYAGGRIVWSAPSVLVPAGTNVASATNQPRLGASS